MNPHFSRQFESDFLGLFFRRNDIGEFREAVIDLLSGFHPFFKDKHVASNNLRPLGTEFFVHLLLNFLQKVFTARSLTDALIMGTKCTDEDHAHHPNLKIGRRSVSACHSESVNDQEVDIPVPQGFPGMFREFLPNLLRILTGLHDERSSFYQTIKRIGVFKNLMIRRNNDFDLLQLGIGDFYRFWTEGQVEVGRSPAFFGAVLGCRFGMQSQHRREDIREQFPARNRSIASNGMEANPDRFLR